MARLVGVRANRVIAFAFAISGVLASMVSFYLVAQTGSVSYKMGVNMVLIAFVASVIGGMGSLAGAALGGFLVGIVSVRCRPICRSSCGPIATPSCSCSSSPFLFGGRRA